MPKNVNWKPQEDLIIIDLAKKSQGESTSGTVSWQEVAKQLQERVGSEKTARQCQHRWNYSLRPGVSKQNEWTQNQQNLLFELQQIHGNKWTLIAEKLGGKAQHHVKNHFYASLRKVIRNINSHISMHRGETFYKGRKPFPETCITKVVSLEQGKSRRLKASRSDIPKLANNIKSNLFRLAKNEDDSDLYKKTIEQLADFNRNCRKLKSKKNKIRFNSSSDSSFQEPPSTSHVQKVSSYFKEDSGRISEEDSLEPLFKKSIPKVEEKEIVEVDDEVPIQSHLTSNNFWMEDNLQEAEEVNFKEPKFIDFQEDLKKDKLGLVKTRDVENEEEENQENRQSQQVKEEKIGWNLDLPIDGILNLPALEDLLEGRQSEEDFLMFGDLALGLERNNQEEEMNYEMECPFNEYFS